MPEAAERGVTNLSNAYTLSRQAAFAGFLAHRHESLLALFEEHLEDNDRMVLPFVLIADIERWAHQALPHHPSLVIDVLNDLEYEAQKQQAATSELIAVGFLEFMQEGPLRDLVRDFPRLALELASIELGPR